jgi:hypothetical protein
VTAVAVTQRRVRFRTARFRAVRALRLEIKHSAAVWVLPVLAALFYFNAYRTAAGYPPTWTLRASVITGPNLIFFSVIAAGIAAWVATREGRRKTGDLLATTARGAWARQATVLAATVCWMVLAYLAGVAVIYLQTAFQATWGGPPLWPVAVGVVGVAASCAVGFTCGTLLPGRFTAPVVAVAVFAAWFVGVAAANNVNNFEDVSTAKGGPALFVATDGGRPRHVDAGVYYHAPPDVSIAQVMFIGGVLLVMVGLLALLPAARVPGVRGLSFAAGRRWLTMVAAVGVACGVAASATAYSLAGTARFSATTDWEIPALHDAADDQPVPYTPDCKGGAFKGGAFTVCIHPAFEPYLAAMSAALQPAAAEIAGLPGAPARAEMTTGNALRAVAGTTPVYDYSAEQEGFGGASFWATPAMARSAERDQGLTADWEQGVQQDFITWFVSGAAEQDSPGPTPAQEAVAIALLAKIGAPVPQYPQFFQPSSQPGASSVSNGPGGSATQPTASAAQITAAANRFESLPSVSRHAWLAANVAGVRSGAVTLAQLP